MNWENGNKLCDILQLEKIARLYHVQLQDLADNTKVVRLPNLDAIEDSLDLMTLHAVPNHTEDVADNIMVTSVMQIPQSEYTDDVFAETAEIPGDTVEVMTDAGETKVIGLEQLQKTQVIEISDLDHKNREERKPELKPQPEPEPAGVNKKLIAGIAVVLALLALVLYMITRPKREEPEEGDIAVAVSGINRIAIGDTYSLYIKDEQTLESRGDVLPDLSAFRNIVQVSAYEDHLAGLQNNGRVVCTGSDRGCEVSAWRGITMIAAGRDHTVGLREDGTVVCSGSSLACDVSSWSDVTAVYAGNELTAARTKNNTVLISGSFDGKNNAAASTKVKDIAVSDTEIAFLFQDGTVRAYGIGGLGNNTGSWTNMAEITAGTDFTVGVNNNGKVVIASTNDELVRELSSWSNVRYLTASGKTVMAVRNGEIIGAGDNSYHQYAGSAQPSSAPEKKLAQVQNISFRATAGGLSISWDKVDNADYYEVRVSTQPETMIKSASNSANIGSDKLTDGYSYKISIIPYNNDPNEYAAGDEVTVNYDYQANKVKLETPRNLRAEQVQDKDELNVSWDPVNDANYYIVAFNGIEEKITETAKKINLSSLEDGKEYTVKVTPYANNDRNFDAGDPASASFTYVKPVTAQPLAVPANIAVNKDDIDHTDAYLNITWTPVEHASGYKVTINSVDFTTNQATLRIKASDAKMVNGTTYNIRVEAVSSDTKRYTNSSGNTGYTLELPPAPTPTPTPTPEPTLEPTSTPEPTPEPTPTPEGETTNG